MDEKILAYSHALNQCMNGKCNKGIEHHRNTVLYWAYHNMADALVHKNLNSAYDFDKDNFEQALDCYHAALPLAINARFVYLT